jgi:hypothetical protein
VAAQFWPLPFPENKSILTICVVVYFICQIILYLHSTFMERDIILLTKSLPVRVVLFLSFLRSLVDIVMMPLSLTYSISVLCTQSGEKYEVRSNMPVHFPTYTLTIRNRATKSSKTMTGSITKWIGIDGRVHEDLLWADIAAALSLKA